MGHTEEFYIDSAGIEGSFRAECFHISVLETLFHSQYIQISNRYVIHLKLICQLYLKKKKTLNKKERKRNIIPVTEEGKNGLWH